MNLNVEIDEKKYGWTENFTFVKWTSEKKSAKPLLVSKRTLLSEIAKLKVISEEIVLILSYITKLKEITFYEEEAKLQLSIGDTLAHSTKISVILKNYEIVKWLEDL